MLGIPIKFDFSGPPPDPDWLIEGLIERNTITVVSADSGVGKSLIAKSMGLAMIQHKPWLGRTTHGSRVMFVDEENFARVIHSRFHALGMTNADRPNLRYFLRLGVQLGAEDWLERVLDEMDEFKPDLLVIDTASAATAPPVEDNNGVVKLYTSTLRPLADQAAVILLHHERKPQQGQRRHAGHAMMGARQWAGQADSHLALKAIADKPHIEVLPDGGMRKTFRLELEMPKNRDGAAAVQKLLIVSEHDEGATRARWLRLEKIR